MKARGLCNMNSVPHARKVVQCFSHAGRREGQGDAHTHEKGAGESQHPDAQRCEGEGRGGVRLDAEGEDSGPDEANLRVKHGMR